MEPDFISFIPDQDQLKEMEAMARVGFSLLAIAARFNRAVQDLTPSTLKMIAEIKHATNMAVLEAFREMAIDKRHWSATLFWMKSHCAHLFDMPEKKEKKSGSTSSKDYVWDPNDPNDRVIFSVYNNDGEPNYPL